MAVAPDAELNLGAAVCCDCCADAESACSLQRSEHMILARAASLQGHPAQEGAACWRRPVDLVHAGGEAGRARRCSPLHASALTFEVPCLRCRLTNGVEPCSPKSLQRTCCRKCARHSVTSCGTQRRPASGKKLGSRTRPAMLPQVTASITPGEAAWAPRMQHAECNILAVRM